MGAFVLCNLMHVYNMTYHDCFHGSSVEHSGPESSNRVRICFGDDEASGFVKLLLKSCLPR